MGIQKGANLLENLINQKAAERGTPRPLYFIECGQDVRDPA
jgi:hypothetical protein